MTRPLLLSLYKSGSGCKTKWGFGPLVKIPEMATDARVVWATIRYPGGDGDQPSPGTPYFVMAKIGGSWRVIKNEMMGEDVGWVTGVATR